MDLFVDHYMEIQIVNSIAMATADYTLPDNGACTAINKMLATMENDFPPRRPRSEVKKDAILKSRLFTSINKQPNTYWVNTEINRLVSD